MMRKYGVMGGLLLACLLFLEMPKPGFAASAGDTLRQGAGFFSDVGDALRDADDARARYYQNRSGRDSGRYEQEWRDYEYKLEEARVQRAARDAKISPAEVRRMREDGRSWKDISDRYKIDSRRMGYGHKGPHGYDRDRDDDMYRHIYKKDNPGKARGHYKGTADGPPGQYKKDRDDRKDGKHRKDDRYDDRRGRDDRRGKDGGYRDDDRRGRDDGPKGGGKSKKGK